MFSIPPLVLLDDLLTTTEKPMFLTLSASIPTQQIRYILASSNVSENPFSGLIISYFTYETLLLFYFLRKSHIVLKVHVLFILVMFDAHPFGFT